MPPDEYQEAANNSIYTNLVANLAVNTARWTNCLLNGEAAAEVARAEMQHASAELC